ncbi:MAG TPA: AAA family ATPase [Gaiellaceae bacterium]|jgi:DNA-binding CsgD family transcriptional regulator|nr:AAA family ATPase [Gaiellaceae bacterium]
MKLLGRRAECEALDQLLADALAGRSRVTVLRGEAGVGKSALLRYLLDRDDGWQVVSARGVQSEMELAYSGLHQLCVPMLDHLERLPVPQRDALATVFGLSVGDAPDRFLVGLATLTLWADAAEGQPLLCVVDDAQWLDQASAQILGFVARRLLAERVALVFAARTGTGDKILAGLSELPVRGLGDSDARSLLLDNVHGPLDAAVCDQIIKESHGNPLALLELPRARNAADLAGGFGVPDSEPVVNELEESYARRLLLLPAATQLLALAAAAEPLGDPVLLHRAVAMLGIDMAAAAPAADADLLKVDGRVEFAHPLARSAAYHAAAADDRHRVHRALAAATDPEQDPDRRAWHRARATPGPGEEIAAELERSAGRAQARGGVAAAAAFLQRAVALTADPAQRGARALDAAEAKFMAGAPGTAVELLATAQRSPLDSLQRARLERLRAQIAFMRSRGRDAPQVLLDAARRLEPLDTALARATYLDAFSASVYAGRVAGDRAMREVAKAARAARRGPDGRPTATDLLLDSLAVRFTDGYVAAAPLLQRALRALTRERPDQDLDLGLWLVSQVAYEVWDDEAWCSSADRAVQMARDRGALTALPALLDAQAATRLHAGRFDDAAALVGEADAITEATGALPLRYAPLVLAAWRGEEAAAVAVIEARLQTATENGEGLAISLAEYANAVLYNGLGRYDAALAAAERAREHEDLGLFHWSLTEVIEAGVRTGRRDAAEAACRHLEERATAVNTHWALGMSARSRALVSSGDDADNLYRESLERLTHCRIAVQLARTQLLYGEWLRRENRRVDAREQLRAAHDFFERVGADGFAERARRELIATGEKVRRRMDEDRDQLTAQEEQIARLARDGLSNPEIGAQLFISARTVEWHLRKVFTKLGIRSRRQLRAALSEAGGPFVSA